MTKDRYFEMCQMMNTEPVEENIPVELGDFPDEVQQAFEIYRILQDTWDPVGGNYFGKNITGIKDIFNIYDINGEEAKFILELISIIDGIRSDEIVKKRKQEEDINKRKSPP